MKPSDFRFLEPLRVRWAEVDLQKIVFNGHYLMYFDIAVAGYWRALAMPYHETLESLHGDLYVRKATLEYEGSARYDERLAVGIRCARIGNSSLNFTAAVFRGEHRLVQGELVYVFADPKTQTSRPVPPPLRAWLEAFEAGQAMVQVQTGDWAALGDEVQALRRTVVADEPDSAADRAVDDADARSVHAVARNQLGRVLGSGRLQARRGGVGRLDRIATLATMRGAGVGGVLLEALLQAARERPDLELQLHAPRPALPFFERHGFERAGGAFVQDGRTLIPMRRLL